MNVSIAHISLTPAGLPRVKEALVALVVSHAQIMRITSHAAVPLQDDQITTKRQLTTWSGSITITQITIGTKNAVTISSTCSAITSSIKKSKNRTDLAEDHHQAIKHTRVIEKKTESL